MLCPVTIISNIESRVIKFVIFFADSLYFSLGYAMAVTAVLVQFTERLTLANASLSLFLLNTRTAEIFWLSKQPKAFWLFTVLVLMFEYLAYAFLKTRL